MKRVVGFMREAAETTHPNPPTHSPPADPAKMKLGSVGPPAPNTECKLVDPGTGGELGPNQEGEAWVRGPQIMKGYLNTAEATARTIDADRCLHTGVIAYADEHRHFFFLAPVND